MSSFNPMLAALQKLREEAKHKRQSQESAASVAPFVEIKTEQHPTPKEIAHPPTRPVFLERVVSVTVNNQLQVQLRILQDPSGIEYGHGATVWDAGILLGKYLAEFEGRQHMVPHTSCLSLGCGCGLSGLVASILGCDVTLTDLPNVLPLTQINIDKNKDALRTALAFAKGDNTHVHRSKTCVAEALDWNKDCDFVNRTFDLILGADLMYDPKLAQPLAATVARLSTPTSTIIIAHEHRKETVDEQFTNAFRQYNLMLHEIPRQKRWDEDLSLFQLVQSSSAAASSGLSTCIQKSDNAT